MTLTPDDYWPLVDRTIQASVDASLAFWVSIVAVLFAVASLVVSGRGHR